MKRWGLLAILMLVNSFARAELYQINRTVEVVDLIDQLNSQRVLSNVDTKFLSGILFRLSDDKDGISEVELMLAKNYVESSLKEIKSGKLQKRMIKMATIELQKDCDQGKYTEATARDIFAEILQPRMKEIVNGRRTLLSKTSEVLNNAKPK